MSTTTGKINVQAENIFPIIKQFLYSDQEIFLRELVSNAVDASQKIKILADKGVFKGELGEVFVEVKLDKEAKTITISDKGIGMDEDEVNKYINEVAFSSAEDFLKKHKDQMSDSSIIGKFGLGFYSAFMAADTVDINTRSYKKSAKAVKWSCDGSPEYTLVAGEKKDRGTDIILNVSEDAVEYLEESRIRELLEKYCKFLPIAVKFNDEQVNNPTPAWVKTPAELKDEDYLAFYKELYPNSEDPLFWIHLNVDYPFNLTGVLYFPRITQNIEVQKDKIQLYCNQVYVTDSVAEIVPDFLTLLHGVIDSPDIPLNVSRSSLQSDPNVKKISSYITKKVADKLESIYKNEKATFEEKWKDIHVFVKYGMLSEDKFYEKANSFCLYKNTEDKHFTLEEYKSIIKDTQTDKHGKLKALYTANAEEQDVYISTAKAKGYDVLVMDNIIDSHFIGLIEQKDSELSFVRVDAESIDKLIEKDEELKSDLSEKEEEKLKVLFNDTISNDAVQIELKPLGEKAPPVAITKPEFMRRMHEMSAMSGQVSGIPESYNLLVNVNHPFIAKLLTARNQEKKVEMAAHLYDLARLGQNMLRGKELTNFIERSVSII